jgi:hypothetical protein
MKPLEIRNCEKNETGKKIKAKELARWPAQ